MIIRQFCLEFQMFGFTKEKMNVSLLKIIIFNRNFFKIEIWNVNVTSDFHFCLFNGFPLVYGTTLFFDKHMRKLGWSSICLRFSQFELEIMVDGMLNFKTHFMVWYCVWYEYCNGLLNIRNLLSSLVLMF